MAAAAPYALMIGGELLKNRAANQQASEQRGEINAALGRTSQTQQKANGLVEAQARDLSPIARAAAMAAQSGANLTGAKADLAAAGATDGQGNAIINTAGDSGAVPMEFTKAKADRALTEGNRLSTIAQQLAKTRAPGQLVEQEGQNRANLTEQIANLWDTTKALNDANTATAGDTQLPGYAAVGDLASAAGSAWAGKGFGAAGGSGKLVPKNAKGGWIWSGGDSNLNGSTA